MDAFLFSLNAVAPLIALVAIGYLLRRVGWMDGDFATKINRLVFRVFLPVTLFLNVYKISEPAKLHYGYILYAMAAIVVIFFLSLAVILALVPQKERRGAVWQASFRSNYALVGLQLVAMLSGEEGVMAASLLTALVVPTFNVLAIISLSVFQKGSEKISVRKVVREILQNPLIRAIFLGVLMLLIREIFQRYGIGFRLADIKPLYTTLEHLSKLSAPLALLVLGAQFEFSTVGTLKKEIVLGVLLRTVMVPVLTLGVAFLFFRNQFNSGHFASFVAVFATPVAVSSVPMAQEMKGDYILMGQLVVWTTFFSAFSIFFSAFLLRLGGAL